MATLPHFAFSNKKNGHVMSCRTQDSAGVSANVMDDGSIVIMYQMNKQEGKGGQECLRWRVKVEEKRITGLIGYNHTIGKHRNMQPPITLQDVLSMETDAGGTVLDRIGKELFLIPNENISRLSDVSGQEVRLLLAKDQQKHEKELVSEVIGDVADWQRLGYQPTREEWDSIVKNCTETWYGNGTQIGRATRKRVMETLRKVEPKRSWWARWALGV